MKFIRISFFAIFVTLICFTSNCQTSQTENQKVLSSKKEELKNYIQWTTNYASQKKFDSAAKYAEKAWNLSENISDKELKATVIYTNSRALYWQTKSLEARKFLNQNIENKTLSDSLKIKSIRLMGEIYLYEESFPEALNQYVSIEKMVRKNGISNKNDSIVLFKTYLSIGIVHSKVNNIDKALNYYDKALLFSNNNPEFENTIVFFKSVLYEEENNLRESIKYSLEGIEISIKNNFDVWLPSYYKSISNCYLKLGIGDSAIYYGKKGLVDNKDCQLEFLYNNVGKGYLLSNNNKNAINYFEKAINYSSDIQAVEIHKNMRDAYISMKNYEKAIYHNNEYIKFKSDVDSLQIQQQLFEITEKYESEKNKLKIEILQTKNNHNNFVIRKKNSQLLLISISLLLSIALLLLIVISYKKQKKQKNLLYLKNRQLALKLKNNEDTLVYNATSENKIKKNESLNIDTVQREKIHDFIKEAILIEFYLDKNISLSEFAKQAKTNTTYLSKVINEDYKKSFAVFINELRISNTLKKLELIPEYKMLTIENISDKAGFSSSSAFYNAFKNFTGLTPSYYVKKRLLQDKAL
ncbi:MAG: hypothetical protein COB12_11015 [Flavobacterium sp.]|nr:MAG: hypothetical protein COB12_11015 [Flavobacterium sp.]